MRIDGDHDVFAGPPNLVTPNGGQGYQVCCNGNLVPATAPWFFAARAIRIDVDGNPIANRPHQAARHGDHGVQSPGGICPRGF